MWMRSARSFLAWQCRYPSPLRFSRHCTPVTQNTYIAATSSSFLAWKKSRMTILRTEPEPGQKIFFGPHDVTTQVFLLTPHAFALVNVKPLVPGHTLICPLSPAARMTDLSPQQLTDIFTATQLVQRMLALRYFSSSSSSGPECGAFNIAIQDGPEAGQTVPHVHVHVLPRIRGVSAKEEGVVGDEIYERMTGEEGNVGGALWDLEHGRPRPGGKLERIEEKERKARGMEEMESEAREYRNLLREMGVCGGLR